MEVMDPLHLGGIDFLHFFRWWNSETRNTAMLRGFRDQTAAGRTSLISTERDLGRGINRSKTFHAAAAAAAAGGTSGGTGSRGGLGEDASRRLASLEATAARTLNSVGDLKL